MATLKFRVLLDSIKDIEVFRDIKINDDANFEVFYQAIIASFGLSNDQMASFFVSNEEWDKGEEISLLDMTFESAFDDSDSPVEMGKVKINERIEVKDQKFILVHDFLSMWIFLIELTDYSKDNIKQPEVSLAVGQIPEELKKTGPNRDNFNFEGEDADEDPFDLNGYDDFDDDDYGYDDFMDGNFDF